MSWIELVAQSRPSAAPPGMQPPENAQDWYRIENNAETPDSTDIYVYDSIGGWFGVYADDFIRDLKAVATSSINLRINSPGGSVFDGVAIANAIRSHPANVTVFVDGLAASIASVIALAGNKLVMMPQTSFMIHDASGGCYGNAGEMEYMRNLLDKQSDNIAAAYATAAGGTTAEWRARMKEETWYTAEEAVSAGIADEVMVFPVKEDDDAAAAKEPTSVYARMQASWDLAAYKYPGRSGAPAPVTDSTVISPEKFVAGGLITAELANGIKLPEGEQVLKFDDVFLTSLRDMFRESVRDEIKAATPPWVKPDEEEETETEDTTDPEAAEAATENEPGDVTTVAPSDEHPTNTGLGDEDTTVESVETYDEWAPVFAQLVHSPLSSADDVFNRLKEAW